MLRTIIPLALLTLAGCAGLAPALQSAAEGARETAKVVAGTDDRSLAARIELGIAKGQDAVSLGCALVNDAGDSGFLNHIRAYCAERN